MEEVFLGLGSNVGEGERTIKEAFSAIGMLLHDARLSRLWKSKAMYVLDQPDFINAAVRGLCDLQPRELLLQLQGIEASFGRDRSKELPKGPRTLDIDILLFGSRVLNEADLIIPHALLHERLFALRPLLDLAPDLRDPRTGEAFSSLASSLPEQGIYLLE